MSKYATGGDLAQLLAALRGARDPWSRIKLVATGARALAKLTPGQRVQLLRQLGLEGAEELAEAAVAGDPRMSDAMSQALRAFENDPRRLQQLASAIADPKSRRATLMGLGAHVIEAITAPAATAKAAATQAKSRGGAGPSGQPAVGASTTPSLPPPSASSAPQPSAQAASAAAAVTVAGAAGAARSARTAAARAEGATSARQAPEARRGGAVQPTPGVPHPGAPQPSTPQPPQPSTPLPPVPGTPPAPPPATPQPPQPTTPPPSTPLPPSAPPPATPTPGSPPTTAAPAASILATPTDSYASPDVDTWPTTPSLFAETTTLPSSLSFVGLDIAAASPAPRAATDSRPASLAALRAWRHRLTSDDLPHVDDAATFVTQQLRPGWAKRRALSALFAKQQPADVDDALALVAQVSGTGDRRWLLRDLAASRAWADDDWQRLLAAASGPVERRRLAMRRARA